MNKLDVIQKNHLKCILSLIICISIIVFDLIGLSLKIGSIYDDPITGVQSYRYFTIISNLVLGFACAACIPYTIEGFRTGQYHLPRWVVDVLYIAVCTTTVTFFITLFISSPIEGYYCMLFQNAAKFFHFINPILGVLLFIFGNSYHTIKFKETLVSIIPVSIYMITYMIMVFMVKEEHGGWEDFYHISTVKPWILVLIAMIPFSLLISFLLGLFHNKVHLKQKSEFRNYFLTSDRFNFDSIDDAILELAKIYKEKDHGGDIKIPRRVISEFIERYKVSNSIEYYESLYLDFYNKI